MLRHQLLHILLLRLNLRRHLLVPDALPLQAPQPVNHLLLAAHDLPDGSRVEVLLHVLPSDVETGDLHGRHCHRAAGRLPGEDGGADDVPGGDGAQGLGRGAGGGVPRTSAQRRARAGGASVAGLLREGHQPGVEDHQLIVRHGLSFTAEDLFAVMGGLPKHPNMSQQPGGGLHFQRREQLLQAPHQDKLAALVLKRRGFFDGCARKT
mmetsp:Transcript_75675/g.202385  ORF Transcript_75675/g.202385 Transcript_75675/m.202385 type:complete len:208 (+) Transcript_75675:669-1292(+)